MKKFKMLKVMRQILSLSAMVVVMWMFCLNVHAEEGKTVVALGADLSAEQRATVLGLMGITEEQLSTYDVVYITNSQEHQYLDSYLGSSVIGSKSLSSVMLKKGAKGSGVNVTTKNINYCTTGMYRNALLTAGIQDTEVIVAAPAPISGTAALIGAVKAYEKMEGTAISEASLSSALDELITTGQLAEAAENEIKLTLEEPTMPTLTLDPEAQEQPAPPEEPQITTLDESILSPEEQKMVDDFSQKIDLQNSTMVMQYGSAAQRKIANFSDTALNNVRTKDLGEVGDQISNLVVELKGFDIDEEEKKGFFGRFKNTSNKIIAMKSRYDSAESNVNKIAAALEKHQVQLMKDVVMLDQLYSMNLNYHKELTMYIIAGKKKLQQERATTLEQMKQKAKQTGLAEDAQAANDFAQQCDSFEKKLHDLELTRMVSVQMSPQIRLVQNNDKLMSDKIQSTLVNTIPLWKSQMVLALGLAHSEQAVRAQKEVTDMTNELLRRNADKLKMSTIETARETERGVVDMETLRHTNLSLIQTLDEVVKIQDEGRAKRRAAEAEIGRLEGELKQKLLDIHT